MELDLRCGQPLVVVGPLLISTMTDSCTVEDKLLKLDSEFPSLTLSGELLSLRSKITKRCQIGDLGGL
jgi:hypothetical protein